MSQSGLEFGVDPKFPNRLQHVMAHFVHIPNKPIHSVFDVQPNQIIPLLDEAWLTVQSLGIKPKLEHGRAVYDVPMGRSIGTKSENVLRIVVESGTSKVVTAFPFR
jgi:filamentous hemagglutinin